MWRLRVMLFILHYVLCCSTKYVTFIQNTSLFFLNLALYKVGEKMSQNFNLGSYSYQYTENKITVNVLPTFYRPSRGVSTLKLAEVKHLPSNYVVLFCKFVQLNFTKVAIKLKSSFCGMLFGSLRAV